MRRKGASNGAANEAFLLMTGSSSSALSPVQSPSDGSGGARNAGNPVALVNCADEPAGRRPTSSAGRPSSRASRRSGLASSHKGSEPTLMAPARGTPGNPLRSINFAFADEVPQHLSISPLFDCVNNASPFRRRRPAPLRRPTAEGGESPTRKTPTPATCVASSPQAKAGPGPASTEAWIADTDARLLTNQRKQHDHVSMRMSETGMKISETWSGNGGARPRPMRSASCSFMAAGSYVSRSRDVTRNGEEELSAAMGKDIFGDGVEFGGEAGDDV